MAAGNPYPPDTWFHPLIGTCMCSFYACSEKTNFFCNIPLTKNIKIDTCDLPTLYSLVSKAAQKFYNHAYHLYIFRILNARSNNMEEIQLKRQTSFATYLSLKISKLIHVTCLHCIPWSPKLHKSFITTHTICTYSEFRMQSQITWKKYNCIDLRGVFELICHFLHAFMARLGQIWCILPFTCYIVHQDFDLTLVLLI